MTRREIARRWKRGGRSYEVIAQEVGVGVTTVVKHVAAIREEQNARNQAQIHKLCDDTVAQYEQVIEEAWTQFDRSCQDEVTVRVEQDPDGEERKERKVVTRKGQSGNPAYLKTICTALNNIADLRGLRTPDPIDVNLNLDINVTHQHVATLELAAKELGLDAEEVKGITIDGS